MLADGDGVALEPGRGARAVRGLGARHEDERDVGRERARPAVDEALRRRVRRVERKVDGARLLAEDPVVEDLDDVEIRREAAHVERLEAPGGHGRRPVRVGDRHGRQFGALLSLIAVADTRGGVELDCWA